MANKGQDITKKPRKPGEMKKLMKAAKLKGGDTLKVFLFLRYTGCHPRVIMPFDYKNGGDKDFKLCKTIDENGRDAFQWERPKKRGAKAHTTIPIHPNIDYDVIAFKQQIQKRKNKYKRSTSYANRLIKNLGDKIDIFNLSPLSLRHTLAVELVKGGMREGVVCDTMNISRETLRTYARFVPEDRHIEYDKAMGLE